LYSTAAIAELETRLWLNGCHYPAAQRRQRHQRDTMSNLFALRRRRWFV